MRSIMNNRNVYYYYQRFVSRLQQLFLNLLYNYIIIATLSIWERVCTMWRRGGLLALAVTNTDRSVGLLFFLTVLKSILLVFPKHYIIIFIVVPRRVHTLRITGPLLARKPTSRNSCNNVGRNSKLIFPVRRLNDLRPGLLGLVF